MNYKRKSRFFVIFILKIEKFCQKFNVNHLPENMPSNNHIFAKGNFKKKFSFYCFLKEKFLITIFPFIKYAKISKIFTKKNMNYKRKSRFFGIFILKIKKFVKNLLSKPFQKTGHQITGFFAKINFIKGNFLIIVFYKRKISYYCFL